MIFEQRIMDHNNVWFSKFFWLKNSQQNFTPVGDKIFSGDIVVILVTESHVNVNILLFCFGSGNNEFKKVRKFP